MDIRKLVQPHILKIIPYSSARKEYSGETGIFLDANENPYENGYNRYPDPFHKSIRQCISDIYNINVKNIFVGNGSDEIIDLIIRLFCIPGKDGGLFCSLFYMT